MFATRVLRSHTPLIQFIGKRSIPEAIDHTPRPHPASPTHSLPTTFKQYRENAAIQHGRLGSNGSGQQQSRNASSSSSSSTATHQSAARNWMPGLKQGEFMDRNQLPERFGRLRWSPDEIDAISSGGASMWS